MQRTARKWAKIYNARTEPFYSLNLLFGGYISRFQCLRGLLKVLITGATAEMLIHRRIPDNPCVAVVFNKDPSQNIHFFFYIATSSLKSYSLKNLIESYYKFVVGNSLFT